MPKALEKKLKHDAREKFPHDKERQNAYVYGTSAKPDGCPSASEDPKESPTLKPESTAGFLMTLAEGTIAL